MHTTDEYAGYQKTLLGTHRLCSRRVRNCEKILGLILDAHKVSVCVCKCENENEIERTNE